MYLPNHNTLCKLTNFLVLFPCRTPSLYDKNIHKILWNKKQNKFIFMQTKNKQMGARCKKKH
jgi:hypothetical protein